MRPSSLSWSPRAERGAGFWPDGRRAGLGFWAYSCVRMCVNISPNPLAFSPNPLGFLQPPPPPPSFFPTPRTFLQPPLVFSNPPRPLTMPRRAVCDDDCPAPPLPLYPPCVRAPHVSIGYSVLPFLSFFLHNTRLSIMACLAISIDRKSTYTLDGSCCSSKFWSESTVSMRMVTVTLGTSYPESCTFFRASSSASPGRQRLRRTWNVVVTYWIGISIFGSHTILANRSYRTCAHYTCVKHELQLHLNRLIELQRVGKASST